MGPHYHRLCCEGRNPCDLPKKCSLPAIFLASRLRGKDGRVAVVIVARPVPGGLAHEGRPIPVRYLFGLDLEFQFSLVGGNGVGSLKGPSGVAVDSDGDVYMTDLGNHRVQIYDADGRYITALVGDAQEPSPWHQTYLAGNPEHLKARRRADMEPEWRFRRPVAVNVDAKNRIVVLESARHRLQIYNKIKDYEEHSLNL